MTTDVLTQIGNKWWPLPPEKFFTAQRAPDMWFADELPPTMQEQMLSPLVTQPKMMIAFQISQQLAVANQRHAAEAQQQRFRRAKARVGKRSKSSRN